MVAFMQTREVCSHEAPLRHQVVARDCFWVVLECLPSHLREEYELEKESCGPFSQNGSWSTQSLETRALILLWLASLNEFKPRDSLTDSKLSY
ncbi:hypothetical protein FGO68_gene16907 [Halteria grandinella]|uniref:Uncharacterized protein n=1 Tax=Halteria grandinella TaxID=5974 RepID=A0A8J8P590_HALGN|nr:hypothetical protein FGO68_gene16907 [Halteria grandinella]